MEGGRKIWIVEREIERGRDCWRQREGNRLGNGNWELERER